MNATPEGLTVQLTRAEALVLFEWLVRVGSTADLPVEHPSEERVLWRIESQLESALAEPMAANYDEVLAAARKEVLGSDP
jgi:hypothetical protein